MRESTVKKLIDAYPNDADLGEVIRKMYNEKTYSRKNVLRTVLCTLFYVAIVAIVLLLMLSNKY